MPAGCLPCATRWRRGPGRVGPMTQVRECPRRAAAESSKIDTFEEDPLPSPCRTGAAPRRSTILEGGEADPDDEAAAMSQGRTTAFPDPVSAGASRPPGAVGEPDARPDDKGWAPGRLESEG